MTGLLTLAARTTVTTIEAINLFSSRALLATTVYETSKKNRSHNCRKHTKEWIA